MGDEPEAGQVGQASPGVARREQALEVGGDQERRRRALGGDGRGRHGRVEPAQDHDVAAGRQRPAGEPDRRRVVQRRAHQVGVGGVEAPQLSFLGGERGGVRLVEDPGPHALRRPGRARRVVHGAGQRPRRQLGAVGRPGPAGAVPLPRRQRRHPGVVEGERHVGVRQQGVALGGQQHRVEHDRHDAGPQGAEHDAQQVGARRRHDADPVAGGEAPAGQPGGDPPLAALGVGRSQPLVAGHPAGAAGTTSAMRPVVTS
jgi:hypothetical protein